ncbi:hypothetical protein ACMZOO_00875 [Catenovulum sp. SX2]|uniref:hypothetical protein n=1 Tax=Catenovulum sp. SX2 TaxID=3398614 RepID=UPI003F8490A2
MDSDIKLDVCFRFLELSQQQAIELEAVFHNVKFGRHFKSKQIVGLVALDGQLVDAIGNFMQSHDIEPLSTDIFVSFITEYDSRIIELPDFVAKASIALGVKINLSYTVL